MDSWRNPKEPQWVQVADHEGETVVTVQEVGGMARKVANIQNILRCTSEDMTAYEAETTIKRVSVSPTNDGDVIGGLPE